MGFGACSVHLMKLLYPKWLSALVRRESVCLLIAGLLSGCDPQSGQYSIDSSAEYPTKTITIICPWNAGGGTDRVSRFLADALKTSLDVPCVVQNKTGGSGAVGHSFGANAKPDGYTITMGTFELSTMHWMGISDLTYERYTPLMQVNADAAALIVHKDAPWNSLQEFLDYVKANPGKVQMSGTATGGAWDLARAGFQIAAGLPVDSILWIPTQGSAPSLVELMGGHIDAVCCSVPEAAAQIEAGELRVLSVMSGERLADYPDYPTCKEAGIDWEMVGWRGLMLPLETPESVVIKLTEAFSEITHSEAYQSFMKKNGFGIELKQGNAFKEFLRSEDAKWEKVIDATGYASQQ
jgi:tripartite-type tricarboxylate transporter receptor subunit TctC